MKMQWQVLFASWLAIVAIAHVRAEEPAPDKAESKSAAKTAASADEIAQWVKDLDSNSFTTRQTAARKLAEAGKEAIQPLAKAASGDSLEVTRQAIDILRRFHQSGDDP